MKKLIILIALVLNACTTVRRDDHSYTYIHNFNSYSEEKPSKPFKPEEDLDDYPFYEKSGLGQSSAVIDDSNQKSSITHNHNHYYPQKRAAYNPPPPYSGFAPSARRYLIHGEFR
jgi:hypothetical protein